MNCAFRSPLGTYRLIMPRFLKLWLYARAFVTRYPGFLRLRGSPCFSLALYGIICAGFMMLCFYTTRANFAMLPHPNKTPAHPLNDKCCPTSTDLWDALLTIHDVDRPAAADQNELSERFCLVAHGASLCVSWTPHLFQSARAAQAHCPSS
jgi:hypothetical protein